MFCCAEMRCWCNDACAMRKMMCRCAAMEGESSQGEPLAKPHTLQLSWKRALSACSLHSQPAPPKEELFAICR